MSSPSNTVTRSTFGLLPSGETVELVTLRLASGVSAGIITFGASLQSYAIPDAKGQIEDCVLGHDDLHGYLATRGYFGATIGRFGNRIAGGRFTLEGQSHSIPTNDGPHALHGGPDGFDQRNWRVVSVDEAPFPTVTMELVSPDGDQGFPGTLAARVVWRLDDKGLQIELTAESGRLCPVSLTNHAFFNLGGGLAGADTIRSAMDHRLELPATLYLPVDAGGIPEGPALPVAGTPFDFRAPRRVGDQVRSGDPQVFRRRGYDHCYLPDGEGLRLHGRLVEPVGGRQLAVRSDAPGVQFYSGNFLDGTNAGKGGVAYRQGDAVCLEPQNLPDAPNRPDFPEALVGPGKPYAHVIRFDYAG